MFRLKYTSTYGSLSPRAFLNLANRCSGSGASAILFLAFCQINTRMVECGRQAGDALCEQEPHQHDSINPRKLPQVWPRCVSNTARCSHVGDILFKKDSVKVLCCSFIVVCECLVWCTQLSHYSRVFLVAFCQPPSEHISTTHSMSKSEVCDISLLYIKDARGIALDRVS